MFNYLNPKSMYKEILVEGHSLLFPCHVASMPDSLCSVSSYFIRGVRSPGQLSVPRLFGLLRSLQSDGVVRGVTLWNSEPSLVSERVQFEFLFDCFDYRPILQFFMRCGSGLHPVPDLEFVHPSAHCVLFSLGLFSLFGGDNYLSNDPYAYRIR